MGTRRSANPECLQSPRRRGTSSRLREVPHTGYARLMASSAASGSSASDGERSGPSLLRSGIALSLLTFASRILGLVREMVKAAYLGTTPLSDAFTVAFMIPNLLRRLFAEGSVAVAFIPTFKEYREKRSPQETKEFLSSTFTVLLFLVTIVAAIGIATAPLLTPIFGTQFDETTFLTRLMFPYLVFVSVAAFLQGILNSANVFAPTGVTPILLNLMIIGATVLGSPAAKNPARAMAIGVLLGGAVQAAFQLPFVLSRGFRFSLAPLGAAFRNPGTRAVLRLIAPTIVGMAAYQLNDIVSTALAGNAGPGVASSLQFSLRLQELILGIFAVSIGTVILPELSTRSLRGEWRRFNETLSGAVKAVTVLTLPVTAFSLAMGKPLVSLLFKSGSFTDESVALTLGAFHWHIVGLFFIATNRVVTPAFYARKDTATPTVAGIVSFGVNMAAAALLVGPYSGRGIAAALSLASAVNTALLFAMLGRKEHSELGPLVKDLLRYVIKISVFSALASAPLFLWGERFVALFGGHGRLYGQGLPLLISGVGFAAVGIALLLVTRDPQATQALAALSRRARRGRERRPL